MISYFNTKLLLINGLENLMIQSVNAWNAPRTKLTSINVPKNPMLGEGKVGAMKITWDRVNEMKRKVSVICWWIIEIYTHGFLHNIRRYLCDIWSGTTGFYIMSISHSIVLCIIYKYQSPLIKQYFIIYPKFNFPRHKKKSKNTVLEIIFTKYLNIIIKTTFYTINNYTFQ